MLESFICSEFCEWQTEKMNY